MGYYADTKIGALNRQGEKERENIEIKKERQKLKRKFIKWSVYFLILTVIGILISWKYEWSFLLGLITTIGLVAYSLLDSIQDDISS
jgi:Mg2+/citrate symporter